MIRSSRPLVLLTSILLSQAIFCFNIREIATFAKGFVKSPSDVGSPFPCSSSVGYELMNYIVRSMNHNPSKPLRILEVGAGTGSITQVLARVLRPIDHLDCIERSPEYCATLQQKFGAFPNISIHCVDFNEFRHEISYDFIVSTLPLNSFDLGLLNGTITQFKTLIKPGGIVSYVAIAGMAQAKQYFSWGNAKKKNADTINVLNQFRKQYQIDSATVLTTCPPIRVYHLKL